MSDVTVVLKVDWDSLPQDTAMTPDLSRHASGKEASVLVPSAKAETATQHIGGQRNVYADGSVEVIPDVPAEAKLPYFADGWTSIDRPRNGDHTDAIRSATIGYGIATKTGHLIAEYGSLSEAVAAKAAYDAKHGTVYNAEVAAAEFAAAKLDQIKSDLAPADVPSDEPITARSLLPADKRYTGKGRKLVTAAELTDGV